jgi:glucokinase
MDSDDGSAGCRVGLSVGVDIGGTKIAVGIVDDAGVVIDTQRMPTPKAPAMDVLADVITMIRDVIGDRAVDGIGVGVPGGIAQDRSFVYFAPNLYWTEVPVGQTLQAAFDVPIVVENDGNAAAWGEFRFGAGADVDDCIAITIGTGIGGGIIIDGRLVRGAHGIASEIGHMNAIPDGRPCACGRRGCWEQYASGNALVREARAFAAERRTEADVLLALGDGTPEGVQGAHVSQAARLGDPVALAAFASVGMWLGRGLADLTAVLDPAAFVIGGGVSDSAEFFVDNARVVLTQKIVGLATRPMPEVRIAQLGNDAGLVGAADLARVDPR